MIYYIEYDWQKVPKEETVGIMGVKGATFYFLMFCYFICVFVIYNLWVLVCVLSGMPTPCSWIGDGVWFPTSLLLWRWRWCEKVANALGGGWE